MKKTTHEDFYQRLRERITTWSERNNIKPAYAHYLLALPDIFHLVAKLALDPRVSVKDKTLLGIALAYVVSPLDILPDFFGPVAYLDDLLVCVLVLDAVLKRVPKSVVAEHWAGSGDVLTLIRETLAKADSWGMGLRGKVVAYLSRTGVWDKAEDVVGRAKTFGRNVRDDFNEAVSRKAKPAARASAARASTTASRAAARGTVAARKAAGTAKRAVAAGTARAKSTAKKAVARAAAKKTSRAKAKPSTAKAAARRRSR